jgi:hypothetical protein
VDFCDLHDLVCGMSTVCGAANGPVRAAHVAGDCHNVSFCICISNYGATGYLRMLVQITAVVSPFRRGSSPYRRHQLRGRLEFRRGFFSIATILQTFQMIGFGGSGTLPCGKYRPLSTLNPAEGTLPMAPTPSCDSLAIALMAKKSRRPQPPQPRAGF